MAMQYPVSDHPTLLSVLMLDRSSQYIYMQKQQERKAARIFQAVTVVYLLTPATMPPGAITKNLMKSLSMNLVI